ncbi:MAG: winged helix-turn-helix domain-containing protein, partial [Pseudomonadota bacterium]
MPSSLADLGKLLGDDARSAMLEALLGGRALTATELSIEAGVTAQTASTHLKKLADSKLLIVRKQGRHKYFQLTDHHVADMLTSVLLVSDIAAGPKTGPIDLALREARVCYDHLAGEIGVRFHDHCSTKGWITADQANATLTSAGAAFFETIGFEPSDNGRRPLCKSCLDWSERRSHLGGQVGAWLLTTVLARGWG